MGITQSHLSVLNVHARELRALEQMTSHRELAAVAALYYCAEEGLQPPEWAVKLASLLSCSLLKREKSPTRGRAAGIVGRYRQDMIDFERWNAVKLVRENQKRIREEVKLIKQRPDDCSIRRRKDREKLLDWLKNDWDRAFECAAMTLRGRRAYAGPYAMRRSYRKVQKLFYRGGDPTRYYQLDDRFLLTLGFEGPCDRKEGTKILPLYNLTI
jgi:hypothetical protein